MLTPSETDFIIEHANEQTSLLLFAAGRYKDVNVAHCASVIEARRKIRDKVPLWYNIPNLDYPLPLSVEQCSSQSSAEYKLQFIKPEFKVADLTGGLGVDSYFLSRKAAALTYVERNRELFNAVIDNFSILECNNISFINADCLDAIRTIEPHSLDLLYIDPARRDKSSKRVYSISDCEPNLFSIKSQLYNLAPRILVKVSPMADISSTIDSLPDCRQIHIVAVDNECKELLLYLEDGFCGQTEIIATNIKRSGYDTFRFYLSQERNCPLNILTNEECKSVITGAADTPVYIYQPNKAILKSGAFKTVSERFGISKLAASSHLYISGKRLDTFPGRCLKILETVPFNKTGIALIKDKYPKADALAVNFPLNTNEFVKKLSIKMGGDIYLIATTLSCEDKVVFVCER